MRHARAHDTPFQRNRGNMDRHVREKGVAALGGEILILRGLDFFFGGGDPVHFCEKHRRSSPFFYRQACPSATI